MNKLEAAYALLLEARKRNGEIVSYDFNAVRLRLADNTWFKPDFLVFLGSEVEVHETKGFMREAARVRLNVAARLYPCFRFLLVKNARTNGQDNWTFTEIPNQ